MSIDSQRLNATLDELRRQLAELGELDAAQRGKLTAALAEIQGVLGNKNSPEAKSLMRRLGEATRHFEEGHPALATSIQSLIDTLGRSGI